jgi:hypothetical protein
MNTTNSLLICETRFKLRSGTISAYMNDPYWVQTYAPDYPLEPRWCIDLYFEAGELGNDEFEPRVYHESLPINIRSWKQLAGTTYEWKEPFDDSGQANGGLYLCEHGNITEAHLRIESIESTLHRVELVGTFETLLGDELPPELSFNLTSEVRFSGVSVAGSGRESEMDMRARFSKYFDLNDFEEDEIEKQGRYESGVEVRRVFFRPST